MDNIKQTRTTQQRIASLLDIPEEFHETSEIVDNYDDIPILPLNIAIEFVVPILPNAQFYAHDAIRKCTNPPADGLTIDESASIKLYTMKAQPFERALYTVLNETFRSANKQTLQPWLFYLKLLRTALSRFPSIRRPIFRGTKLDLSKKYRTGETVVWPGLSSCTTSVNILRSEDFLGQSGDRTMFVIDCVSGKDIRNHSYFPSENEILLLPEAKFMVQGCLDVGHGLHIINLQEIDHIASPTESPSILIDESVRVVHESRKADDIDINTIIEMFVNEKDEEQSEAKENVMETYETSVADILPDFDLSATEPLLYDTILDMPMDASDISNSNHSTELKPTFTNEIFDQRVGDVEIAENGLVVVHGSSINSGEVRGKVEYTTGKHQLRFQIEKSSAYIFIGIISKTTPIIQNSYLSSSSYGWISQDHYHAGGVIRRKGDIFSDYDQLENDIIELLIDVTTQTLHYTNERTKQSCKLTVDLNKCPLPWQLIINLSSYEDRVRLLSCTNDL